MNTVKNLASKLAVGDSQCATMLRWWNFSQRKAVWLHTSSFNFVCRKMSIGVPAVCCSTDIAQCSRSSWMRTASTERDKQKFECLLKLTEELWLDRLQYSLELDTVTCMRWYQLWHTGNFVVIEFPTCYWVSTGRNTWIIMWIMWKSDTSGPVSEDVLCFCTCVFVLT